MIKLYRDPLWEIMDLWSRPFSDYKLCDNGLRKIINRPHNLINVKDEDGQIIAQKLEIVSTPFKKEDVSVSITDNTLSVKCGNENIKTMDNEEYTYKGISSQSYSFALHLAPSVDQRKITAENKDGMLTINLPLKAEEEKKPDTVNIDIA